MTGSRPRSSLQRRNRCAHLRRRWKSRSCSSSVLLVRRRLKSARQLSATRDHFGRFFGFDCLPARRKRTLLSLMQRIQLRLRLRSTQVEDLQSIRLLCLPSVLH
ncbi:hypothetical protein PPTG_24947 [Phytophthora nicotianae INRA-310]|uniref:Uncharacterized protein n=1 Tax=Phytophthora nicotianae (strain INRA-310) TaxID=761204 RepID=W2PBT5_PHYN3|nr:hypothetical protein PPTG_24947 [Phytophthora nicotianae INRA-310]ETM97454.1 hypothetical protein PPTG_24947 [Phytophthora nicotianae INRA-310]